MGTRSEVTGRRAAPASVVPEAVRAAAMDALAAADPALRQTFELRLERWWPDLVAGIAEVYPGVPG